MDCKKGQTAFTIPRFLVIGVGPHAKRTYVPHIISFEQQGRAKLVAAVELQSNYDTTREYVQKTCPNIELLFVPFFTTSMPTEVASELSSMVKRLAVTHVIIATEPQAHRAFGLWALRAKLDIIMDRPLTTRFNAAFSKREAYKIAQDHQDLIKAYERLQKKRKTIFVVNCQRRYHPGFHFTLEKLEEISAMTGSPVTNIISTHCDGQWRLPSEIVDLNYHGFNNGYGKVSHSGYHILDCIHLFVTAGTCSGKRPDRIEVVSSFIQPNGFFKTLHTEDYERVFGKETYNAVNRYSDEDLIERFKSYGEIDASIQITFFQDGEAVCLAQANLQHNGFSRRHWIAPSTDLYKKNGRVKHEFHEIKSGPFQTIVIVSRQSKDNHDSSNRTDDGLGSDNHFDIQVFRNCGLTGDKTALTVHNVDSIKGESISSAPSGLLSENVKRGVLENVIEYAEGRRAVTDLKSLLD